MWFAGCHPIGHIQGAKYTESLPNYKCANIVSAGPPLSCKPFCSFVAYIASHYILQPIMLHKQRGEMEISGIVKLPVRPLLVKRVCLTQDKNTWMHIDTFDPYA